MNHRKYLHTPIALISVAYEMNSFCNSPQTIYVGVPQKSLFDVGCCVLIPGRVSALPTQSATLVV